MGTIESINEVSNIIENIQNRQGTALGNIHEVSYLKKFISKNKLKSLVQNINHLILIILKINIFIMKKFTLIFLIKLKKLIILKILKYLQEMEYGQRKYKNY